MANMLWTAGCARANDYRHHSNTYADVDAAKIDWTFIHRMQNDATIAAFMKSTTNETLGEFIERTKLPFFA